MGANPKTTAFLKECLADALIKLLETKSIEKITIPEIADLAGVGRTTYFRNFTTKEEIISFKLIALWERWSDAHDIKVRSAFAMDNALQFFSFNYSIKSLLELLYRRGLQSSLYNAFYTQMVQRGTNPFECYKSRFYSYALFGLLDEWISRGFYESPEEMTEILKEII